MSLLLPAAAMRTFSLFPFISSSSLQVEASPKPATATAGNGPTPQNIRDEPPLIGPPLKRLSVLHEMLFLRIFMIKVYDQRNNTSFSSISVRLV